MEDPTRDFNNLRSYIRRIESRSIYRPPNELELAKIKKELQLNKKDLLKLDELANNHLKRAQKAQNTNSYNLAIIELNRACILRPLDSRTRVRLARCYLERVQKRASGGKNERNLALALVKHVISQDPADADALAFLHEYKELYPTTNRLRKLGYLLSGIILFILFTSVFRWQREWLWQTFQLIPVLKPSGIFTQQTLQTEEAGEKTGMDIVISGLEKKGFETQLTSSEIGSRNDGNYLEITGRLKSPEKALGHLTLIIRGHSPDRKTIFDILWEVRKKSDPILIPGDTQALQLFRWLGKYSDTIEILEISPYDFSRPEEISAESRNKPLHGQVIWNSTRPDNIKIQAQIRNPQIYEAFDRLLVITDLAISNIGLGKISQLQVNLSMGLLSPGSPGANLQAVSATEPPMLPGERRVWPVKISLPLNSRADKSPAMLHINNISVQ